jgi:peptidoglycan biosynthesis protein MviN/MurJ (putative lipid II flippase)
MKRVDLEVAVAAGLAVVFPLYKIITLPGTCDSPNPLTLGKAVALLAVLASYLSVPLLFRLLGGQRGARFVWLWTPVLGSLLSTVTLYSLVGRSVDWGLELSAKVWLALCVWTLPLAVIVYYSGMIIRGIRRWHEGPKENLSISRR